METIRLQQMLKDASVIDVTCYHVVCSFLETPQIDHLLALTKTLDETLISDTKLKPEQSACIQYLFRDWGYQYLKRSIKPSEKKTLFNINGKQDAPGHFFAAIDYAKRVPKENQVLMRFGLTLLLHSSLPEAETKPKIEAIEQLLSTQSTSLPQNFTPQFTRKTLALLTYNVILTVYLFKQLINLQTPFS